MVDRMVETTAVYSAEKMVVRLVASRVDRTVAQLVDWMALCWADEKVE